MDKRKFTKKDIMSIMVSFNNFVILGLTKGSRACLSTEETVSHLPEPVCSDDPELLCSALEGDILQVHLKFWLPLFTLRNMLSFTFQSCT